MIRTIWIFAVLAPLVLVLLVGCGGKSGTAKRPTDTAPLPQENPMGVAQ
jgi:hypothetical protein